MIILDTNVVSELMRPTPEPAVRAWIAGQPIRRLHTTSITQAEILHGLALLPSGTRRDRLRAAVGVMFDDKFAGRVLPFDSGAAVAYALIAADRRKAGRPISHFDTQIAAIARFFGATLATHNVNDFEGCGIEVINPWGG